MTEELVLTLWIAQTKGTLSTKSGTRELLTNALRLSEERFCLLLGIGFYPWKLCITEGHEHIGNNKENIISGRPWAESLTSA